MEKYFTHLIGKGKYDFFLISIFNLAQALVTINKK